MPRRRGARRNRGGGGTRIYLKVLATFKCSNARCGKTWNSAHAWERDEEVFCEFCHKKADLADLKDEMVALDMYVCSTPTCDNRWHCIHDGEEGGNVPQQECDQCHQLARRNGVQDRFGRHYWFVCVNDACPVKPEWEDASIEPQRTQRCTKCVEHARGDIIRVQPLNPRHWMRRRNKKDGDKEDDGGDPGFGIGKGKHVADYCDMCMDLRRQGKAERCHNFRKVVVQLVAAGGGDGQVEERIVQIE